MTKRRIIKACIVLLLLNAGCSQRSNREIREPAPQSSLTRLAPPQRISAENTDAAEPAIAATRDGSAYVAWIEHREKRQADLFVARLDGEGRLANTPVRVNPKEGEAKGWRGDPPTIAVAPDKTVYVGWTARLDVEGHGNNLYLSASRDEGRTFGPPVKVNDDEKPASHGMHSLAVSTDNRVYVAWLDERNVAPAMEQPMPGMNQKTMEHAEPNSEVFFSFSTDGGRTFNANQKLASEACPCCKTALAAGSSNQVYVSWRQVLPGDFRHIAVAASTDAGRNFASPQIVSDDSWRITGCPVSGPALSVGSDGALRVVWYTAGERGSAGLYWAESRNTGQTFTERKLLAGGQVRGNPSLMADEKNNLIAVWESDDEREPRIISAQLMANGAATTTTGPPLAGSAELPSVATTNEQLLIGYIVSSKDQRSIWIARAKPTV
jgi:hypothetical protein